MLACSGLDYGSRARGIWRERLRRRSHGREGPVRRYAQWGAPSAMEPWWPAQASTASTDTHDRQRQTGAQGRPPRSRGEEQVLHGVPSRQIRQSHAFP